MAATNTESAKPRARANGKHDVAEKARSKDGKIDWNHVDTEIERHGSKIILPAEPEAMPEEAAIEALKRKKADLDTVLDTHEFIDAFPLDGAVAFTKALRQKYGWATSVPTPGFFRDTPPQMLTVDVGPHADDKLQVPWGGFKIPGIDNPVHSGAHSLNGQTVFVLFGKIKKREAHILKELADLTRKIVAEESIYRGKAIRLRADGDLTDFKNPPQFIDAMAAKPEELVLARSVEEQVKINLWTLIEKTDACRAAKIPLKRGILLEGKYGGGKSLTAFATARKCVEHGWTYILLDRVSGLKTALEFAKRYQPAVVFAEDIDRATQQRTEQANDLLNILDGVLSKTSEIMVVLTTNEIDKIYQGMLRPGRLDAVISITPPDAEAVGRLLRIYGAGLIDAKENLDNVCTALAGQIPATIREVVERAKLGAVGRDSQTVNEDDLLVASKYMENHLRLLNRPTTKMLNPEERVGIAFADILRDHVGHAVVQGVASLFASIGADDIDELSETDVERIAAKLRKQILRPSGLVETRKASNGNGGSPAA